MNIPIILDDLAKNISIFENKVLKGLSFCGVDLLSKKNNPKNIQNLQELKIGAAVSGGADSISLLYSLAHILNNFNLSLEVITVNHFIREKNETCGDADFVIKTCESLALCGFNVHCTLVELGEGEVINTARLRQAGIEEAARFLRYNAFENFINKKNLDFLCLAHNKNDQLETLLMRFLQGSNVDAAGGIKVCRNHYIRPLLEITRNEIETYLTCQKITWRNDSSNDDTNYFRNNIRHNLIPFLNDKFSGWERAVLAGAEKADEDAFIINKLADSFKLKVDNNKENISFNICDFIKEPIGIQKRILIKACNAIGENKRIPNLFLNDVISSIYNCENKEFSKFYNSIEILVKKDTVFIKKYIKKDTDLVFFDIIEKDGVYNFPFGELSVTFNNSVVLISVNNCETVINCRYPFCVRNAQQGDEIRCSNGKMKKITDIYSDWHVINSDKNLIPLICGFNNSNNVIGILSAFLGYKDWIVK